MEIELGFFYFGISKDGILLEIEIGSLWLHIGTHLMPKEEKYYNGIEYRNLRNRENGKNKI